MEYYKTFKDSKYYYLVTDNGYIYAYSKEMKFLKKELNGVYGQEIDICDYAMIRDDTELAKFLLIKD